MSADVHAPPTPAAPNPVLLGNGDVLIAVPDDQAADGLRMLRIAPEEEDYAFWLGQAQQAAVAPTRNTARLRLPLVKKRLVALIVVSGVAAVIVAMSSGGSSSKSSGISRSDAMTNVIDQINSGPNWETAQMSAAVGANLDGDSGANEGCAFDIAGGKGAGFACYLEYESPNDPAADPSTGVVDVYFAEDSAGHHIHPISVQQYNQLIGG
jgi:hypothetical protein